ncbi:MAG: hypothetical protein ABSC94_22305 [Polyangiaceae bacterium]|jgi:hypothetical protein
MGSLLAAAFASATQAEADESCGRPDRPWIAVAGAISELPDVVPLMRADLAARQIDVCVESAPHRSVPVAVIDVTPEGRTAAITVEVRDRLTAKRVVREVDLAGVPADGRALTLAAAAVELLRATWAELALAEAPPPAEPVPSAVQGMVDERRDPARTGLDEGRSPARSDVDEGRPPARSDADEPRSPAPKQLDVSPAPASPPPPPSLDDRRRAAEGTLDEGRSSKARGRRGPWIDMATMLVFELGPGGILYGADARVSGPEVSRFTSSLRVGFREAPVVSTRDGQISASALLAGVGASLRTTPAESRFALDVLARADVVRLNYEPVAFAGATASRETGISVLASAGVDGWMAFGSAVRLASELLVELPVRPVQAQDGGKDATGLFGVGMAAGVGLGVVF